MLLFLDWFASEQRATHRCEPMKNRRRLPRVPAPILFPGRVFTHGAAGQSFWTGGKLRIQSCPRQASAAKISLTGSRAISRWYGLSGSKKLA